MQKETKCKHCGQGCVKPDGLSEKEIQPYVWYPEKYKTCPEMFEEQEQAYMRLVFVNLNQPLIDNGALAVVADDKGNHRLAVTGPSWTNNKGKQLS